MNEDIFDFTGLYLIVLTEMMPDRQLVMYKILRDCWALNIANVNVLTPSDATTKAVMYTFFPYTRFHCNRVEPVVQNYYTNGTVFYQKKAFENKFRNFHKCNVMISTCDLRPFMIITENEDGSFSLGGVEGRLLDVFSKLMNYTPVIDIIPTQIGYGYRVLRTVSKFSALFF